MPLTVREVKEEVVHHIGQEGFDSLLEYLREEELTLWGGHQPDNFLEINLTLMLWKLITGFGYQKVLQKVKIRFPFNHKSLQYNCRVMRQKAEAWAESKVEWGTVEEWVEAAEDVPRKGKLAHVNLWTDSFDLPKENPTGYSRKSPDWSYKLNRYGRRYMVFLDARTRIRWVGGGYSPKVYDSHYINMMRRWIQAPLKGAVVVADHAFATAGEGFEDVEFVVKFLEPADEADDPRGRNVIKLTAEQKRFNKAQKALRSRVESPFGIFKTIFPSLAAPWRESDSQLDHVVLIAAALHNMKI